MSYILGGLLLAIVVFIIYVILWSLGGPKPPLRPGW